MKKKILFGVIFSIYIIMLVNTSTAVEYKTVTDCNKLLLESKLKNINNFIEKIRHTFEDLNINSISILSKNEIKELSDQLSELVILIFDNTSLPTFILNIIEFIFGLLFLILDFVLSTPLPGLIGTIIGTIIGIIFGKILGPLFVFLANLLIILTAPVVLLAKILEFIINLFTA